MKIPKITQTHQYTQLKLLKAMTTQIIGKRYRLDHLLLQLLPVQKFKKPAPFQANSVRSPRRQRKII